MELVGPMWSVGLVLLLGAGYPAEKKAEFLITKRIMAKRMVMIMMMITISRIINRMRICKEMIIDFV